MSWLWQWRVGHGFGFCCHVAGVCVSAVGRTFPGCTERAGDGFLGILLGCVFRAWALVGPPGINHFRHA